MTAVNNTVAVALITALSTLTAAGLTGAVTVLLSRGQLRHQAALAREERAEQRSTHHRDVRREVYERFLQRTDEAYRVLDEGWLVEPRPEPGRWEAGFAARRALDEAFVRVRMEGPEAVVARGREVVEGVGAEFRRYRRVLGADADADGGAASAAAADPAARSEALATRFRTSAEFVTAAREALSGRPAAGA